MCKIPLYKRKLEGDFLANRYSRALRFISLVCLVVILLTPAELALSSTGSLLLSQESSQIAATPTLDAATANEKAQKTLAQMTPEERVGQLFLVTFNGSQAAPGTAIYDLITNYYVGGAVLLAENDNFTNGQIIQNVSSLNRQLQSASWDASQGTRTTSSGESFTPQFIPMFIGIIQEGDRYSFDQILSEVTPLPNAMALGATWNPDLSKQVGAVLGQELSALGFNFLIGPSLDVLETPHMETANDLGTRTFGGDPYWVGKLGSEYIVGVHIGSNGRIAVVPKHFPGHGNSDRLPEEEVATVRKSLDQLISFELAPFFEVTGLASSPEATADGLLTAHIRIREFQGNIRVATRPISFDPNALKLLLELPALKSWRDNGGVMVSDNLGSRAIRGFYDLTSQSFDMPRRVALNAFLAGNDLLYASDFSSGEFDSITSIKRTLEFFAQKYQEDPAFAQRVDESALGILTLKYRLYNDFNLDNILAQEDAATQINNSGQLSFDVARQAATLISPSQEELNDTIPDPPNQNDRIVFVTDTRQARQCSTCPQEPLISKRALEQVVLRLYGPQAGGQVTPANLSSYSLDDLQAMLENSQSNSSIELSLQRANWIVFAMLDSSTKIPSYQTLSRFLVERPDLFQRKRVIVFAFNAPYFLDSTDISKLTAYYCLYSKIPSFIDVAGYLLFQELRAEGASPVSIPGISYDLSEALSPTATQVFPLELDLTTQIITQTIQTTTPAAETPMPAPTFQVGESIPIRAGIILDKNDHPVPDGTQVEFSFSTAGQTSPVRQIEVTKNGIARTVLTITSSGALQIQAVSEPARSNILHLEILSESGVGTLEPVQPTPTITASPTPTLTSTPPSEVVEPLSKPEKPAISDWIISILFTGIIAWMAYKLISFSGDVAWGMRAGLLALIGGVSAYIYMVLKLPGSEKFISRSISQGVFLITLAGAGIGLLLTWLWRAIYKSTRRD